MSDLFEHAGHCQAAWEEPGECSCWQDKVRHLQAINADLAEALQLLLEATEHDDVWMPEGPDQPNHPLTRARLALAKLAEVDRGG